MDAPRADAVHLKDRLAFDPCEMLHSRRPITERARRHHLRGLRIEFGAHPKIQRALNYRDVFDFRVRVRRDFVAVRQAHAHGEETFLRRIALEHRKLRARRQRRRTILPLDFVGRMNCFAHLMLSCGHADEGDRENGNDE